MLNATGFAFHAPKLRIYVRQQKINLTIAITRTCDETGKENWNSCFQLSNWVVRNQIDVVEISLKVLDININDNLFSFENQQLQLFLRQLHICYFRYPPRPQFPISKAYGFFLTFNKV